MRKPWFLLFVLLAFIGAACGGDDGDTEASTTDDTEEATTDDTKAEEEDAEDDGDAEGVEVASASFLRNAAAKTSEEGSGRIELTIELEGMPGTSAPVQLTGTGSYDTPAQLSEITLDMSALLDSLGTGSPEEAAQFEQFFGDGTFTVITDRTKVYMNMPFLASVFGSDADWIMMDASAAGGAGVPGVGSVGTGNPAAMLESLRGVGDGIEKVGNEDVRGVQTTHLRGTLDMQKAIEQVPEGQRAQVEASLSQLGGAGDEIPFDAFVDDDGLVRRFAMDLSAVAGASGEGAAGNLSIDFFDFGTPIEITLPPVDQVFDATEEMGSLQPGGAGA